MRPLRGWSLAGFVPSISWQAADPIVFEGFATTSQNPRRVSVSPGFLYSRF
jgi:hypothetical protein